MNRNPANANSAAASWSKSAKMSPNNSTSNLQNSSCIVTFRYADSGYLSIDNNPVENTIRPIALGKKKWLFTGSERAGKRAAAIQTLLGTAKLNGLNPAQWLADTFEKLPAWSNSRIDELLPFAPEAIEALLKECG